MKAFPGIPDSKYSALSEEALWDRFREGDKGAFDFIYLTFVRLLYNYGIRITPDSVVVEDCLQDLFVELWEKKQRLGATDSIKYYLFKSLRRKILRKLQHEDRFYRWILRQDPAGFEIILSHEHALIRQESLQRMHTELSRAIGFLSKRQKEALFLRYFEGLSYPQIASIMGIQTGAAYKLVCNALRVLRSRYPGNVMPPLLALASLIALQGI